MSSATTGGAVVGLWKDPDFLYTKPPSPNERRVMVKNVSRSSTSRIVVSYMMYMLYIY